MQEKQTMQSFKEEKQRFVEFMLMQEEIVFTGKQANYIFDNFIVPCISQTIDQTVEEVNKKWIEALNKSKDRGKEFISNFKIKNKL